MPVIGRLDDQVDEVLIKPLSKRRGVEDEQTTSKQAPLTESPTEAEPQPATRDEKSEEEELPVWLL